MELLIFDMFDVLEVFFVKEQLTCNLSSKMTAIDSSKFMKHNVHEVQLQTSVSEKDGELRVCYTDSRNIYHEVGFTRPLGGVQAFQVPRK